MSLASTSIQRPVLAIVMSITVMLFGFIGFTFLGVREYPSVDPPVVTVSTTYTGANADVMESQITEPLEETISGIAGVRTIKSVSSEGRSNVNVEFELGVDMEAAANDVRDKVSRAMRLLPPDADNPIVMKADADAIPIVFMSIRSSKRDLLQLTDIATYVFKERLQTIEGVSEIQVWGAKRYAMRLWMDPARLAAYGLSPLDVRSAILRENVELPTGRIEGAATELTVRTQSRLSTPEDFNSLIIRETDGKVVRFRDVGRAELAPENLRSILRFDGVPMVGVVLVPRSGANYIQIVDEFNRRVAEMRREVPDDITVGLGFDSSKYIRQSIAEVAETVALAFILVFVVIYFFLRDLRTTIIPMLAVPVSLIGAFFIMYVMDFSINVLTLLGIVLAIGMVVDDAIVVLENIYTKIELGMGPREAGIRGSSEVYFAVIATTIALAAVFMPVIFLQGITGRLFKEFGIVLAGSVIISAFVALSLTPMMCSRILKQRQQHSRFYRKTEPLFQGLAERYRASLTGFLDRPRWALAIMIVAVALIVVIGGSLPTELAPLEDRSSLRILATGPEGATFEYMDAYATSLIGEIQNTTPELRAMTSVTSPGFGGGAVNSASMFLTLVDPHERVRTQQEIADQLSALVRSKTAARTFAVQEQSIGSRGRGLPVQFVIQAPHFQALKEKLPIFLADAERNPAFAVVDVNLKFNKPEVNIGINRDRARALGVSALDIAQTLQLTLSGQRFDYFVMNGKQYQVIGEVLRTNKNDPRDLRSIFVKNNRGDLIQLDNLVTLQEESNPPALYRFNRYVSATVSASLSQGYTLGQGIDAMREIADRVLDESFSTALDGTSKDFEDSSSSLLFAFLLALVLIYLVLAAQFESFRDPFTIMLTVPLALAGALLTLWYFNQSLNIFSQIGLIMLIGLVTKNGILIVEFANQRREGGLRKHEAVIDAAAARLRPILMTALSTILGTLPIALALGAGSAGRMSMGIAVVGGLVLATGLTLYIIPVMYTSIARSDEAYARLRVAAGAPTPSAQVPVPDAAR
jgi:multidrug efflux pump